MEEKELKQMREVALRAIDAQEKKAEPIKPIISPLTTQKQLSAPKKQPSSKKKEPLKAKKKPKKVVLRSVNKVKSPVQGGRKVNEMKVYFLVVLIVLMLIFLLSLVYWAFC